MAIAYYGAQISPNMTRTPEGYLICRNVPINRIGDQEYTARDLQLDGDPDRLVIVHRYPEDVFDPAAIASFEGKDITQGHPPENLTPENQAAYSKGHIENVRRVGDNTVADLFIKDAALASDVENGVVREVSCGYLCDYVPDGNGYKQQKIRGNHVAVVPRGRAGHEVAIKDAAPEAEKGRKPMSKFSQAILTALGMAAKDANDEELKALVSTADAALDAEPAEPAEPSKDAAPEADPATDEMVEKAPKGDDIGSKLDRILEMLEAKARGGRGEHPLHDESDLDEMVEKLAGKAEAKDPEAAVTVPAEEMEDSCMSSEAKDAAVQLLKKVRPVVAGMKDPKEKARVVDAMLATIKGTNMVGSIMQAAQDSAKANSEASRRTNYQKMCEDSESAYAARNPHKNKEV